MHDNNYKVVSYNVTTLKLPDKNSAAISSYSGWNVANEYVACQEYAPSSTCMNKVGQILAP
jgi:nitrogen fixation protein FixH